MAKRRDPSYLSLALSFGMVCQMVQVVLLREFLTVFHGNELSFGIILAAWMVWVGVGGILTGAAAGRIRNPVTAAVAGRERTTRPLEIIASGLCLLLPATVFALRILRTIHTVQPGAYLSIPDMVASAFLVVAPAGLLLGAMFVLLAMGWRERDGGTDTTAAGKGYIAEAAGHALGGALFTFLLVQRVNSFEVVTGAGLVLAAAAMFVTRGGSRLLIASAVAAAASLPLLGAIDEWAHRMQWRSFAPGHELVETAQSRYGTVSVIRREGQYSFYQSGNLLFSAAGPGAAHTPLEEQEAAVTAHFAMAQHPDPRRILLIGGGFRGVLREVARHPVEWIDHVELDPVVTGLAGALLPPGALADLDRANVRVVHGDGRLFLKGPGDSYDLILVDAAEPVTAVLNRYYTEEFFAEASSRLRNGGVLAIGAVSTADLRGSDVVNRNSAIYHTLRRVFAHVLPAGERHVFFFAANQPGIISAEPEVLEARFDTRGVEAPGFPSRQFRQLLLEEPLRRLNWIIRNHGRTDDAHRVPPDSGPLLPPSVAEQAILERGLPPVRGRFFINSDFRPVGYVHTLAFWSQYTGAGCSAAFSWLLRVEPWWMAPVVLIVLLPGVLMRRNAGRRGPSGRTGAQVGRYPLLVAVFTTGLSTMTLQVALLFAFQAVYGFVYEMVGAIIAGFMAGLALGAAVTQRFVRVKSNPGTLMAVQLAIAACAGGIAIALPWAGAIGQPSAQLALFLGVTFAAGFLNGLDFPLAAACFYARDGRAEQAAGTVYGVELFGACTGALVAGVAVAPVLGVAACCVLAAIGNATAFLVLLISGGADGLPGRQPSH